MKLKDKNIRKIIRVGKGTLAVSLPKEMALDLGWREKQRVLVKREKGKIIIQDWKSR